MNKVIEIRTKTICLKNGLNDKKLLFKQSNMLSWNMNLTLYNDVCFNDFIKIELKQLNAI